jgi:hypothetical protein
LCGPGTGFDFVPPSLDLANGRDLGRLVLSLGRGCPLWPAARSPPFSEPECSNGGKRKQKKYCAENKSLYSVSHGDLQGRTGMITVCGLTERRIDLD